MNHISYIILFCMIISIALIAALKIKKRNSPRSPVPMNFLTKNGIC